MKTSERFIASPFIDGVCRVMDFGKGKHGDNAYLQKSASYHIGKAVKHTIAFTRNAYDDETGEHHFCHVVSRVYFAYECWLNRSH